MLKKAPRDNPKGWSIAIKRLQHAQTITFQLSAAVIASNASKELEAFTDHARKLLSEGVSPSVYWRVKTIYNATTRPASDTGTI